MNTSSNYVTSQRNEDCSCQEYFILILLFIFLCIIYAYILGCHSGSVVKNPPAAQETQETWVLSLGQEDPLEEGIATHSSIPAWRISWTEEPGGLQSTELDTTEVTWHAYTQTIYFTHKQLVEAYDKAQEAQLCFVTTQRGGMGGRSKRKGPYVYIQQRPFIVQQ